MDGFREALLAWYDDHKRSLPWRTSTEPYAVLVSEIMCQQTRVDVVIPYYESWMQRWPTAAALAQASHADVMAAWSGLGYYNRARNLHAAAQQISATGWPENLQDLPGVGPYVAGALGSIAFNRPVAAIDGNVTRVIARWFGIDEPVDKAAGKNAVAELAGALVRPDRPGDWTQAIMEFGALVCTPAPRCSDCPVRAACASRQNPSHRPRKAPRPRPVNQDMHFAVIQDGQHVLLVQRGPGLLANTWALPGGPKDTPIEDHVREQTGAIIRTGDAAGRVEHVFSHRRWRMDVHRAQLTDEPRVGPSIQWVAMDQLHTLGVSTAMRKALAVVQ